MRAVGLLLAVVAATGCQSSAPYTIPAAALNTAAAVGAALGQRAAGGCYATCSHGTVCNPNTGTCESPSAAEFCDKDEGGAVRCVPILGVTRRPEGAAPTGVLGTGIGISPATGTVPPPPAEASPKPPGTAP